MTSTTTSTTTNLPEGVEFGYVDPRILRIETNIRTAANLNLNPGFLHSLQEFGVLQAVLVQRTDEVLSVRDGQRRTLGAIEVELETIPALIVTGDEDNVRRVLEQLAANDDREALADADRAAAYQQLALYGVSAQEIAQARGVSEHTVHAGIAVASSRAGLDALNHHALTLKRPRSSPSSRRTPRPPRP